MLRRAARAALGAALLLGPAPGLAQDPAPRETTAPPPRPARGAEGALGQTDLAPLLRLRGEGGGPLTIQSDEVELQALDDQSRVVRFKGTVRVEQGGLRLEADTLEAVYPPQESEPGRLTARGHVRIEQPGQRAFCDEAEYARAEDRLSCRGDARLIQGCDVARGDVIEFDLTANRARVVGRATVVIAPREGAGDCAGTPTDSEPAP